ncbi:MAG: hypothetical protein JWN70_6542 [Planctomycetaceae bacterium]|nr:hypothetical protein [Planctomycetaceae bacterium]
MTALQQFVPFALLPLLIAAGCGEAKIPTGKLSGKITYKAAPVTGGTVTFRNNEQGIVAAGTLDASGEYHLMFAGGPEVPAGDYVITITPPETHVPIASELVSVGGQVPVVNGQRSFPNIPAKYRSFNTSGLKKTIDEGENSCDLTLDE